MLRSAGAGVIAEEWERLQDADEDQRALWQYPTSWLDGDHEIAVGSRTIDAVHTPGHTPGHYVFAERAEAVLFAGDHVLPTITPSIGFTVPPMPQPLGDFMASLTKVRAPARPAGAARPRTRRAVDARPRRRAARPPRDAAGRQPRARRPGPAGSTAYDVARGLGWTRHLHAFDTLDWFSRGMAAMETKAHLDLLVARGDLVADDGAVATDGVRYALPSAAQA